MKINLFKKSVIAVFLIFIISAPSGCLKTRSQIKNDDQQPESADSNKTSGPQKDDYGLEEIKNEITRISGKLDDVEHNQQLQNTAELKETLSKLDARIAEVEKEFKEMKDKTQKEAAIASTPTKDLFAEASQFLKEKNYEAAAEKYQEILSKGVKNKEAAEAHYGMGESEFGLKDYKKAIVEYSKVQDSFAKSPRIPSSLYKIGVSFEYLNMQTEAKGFYNELLQRFPNSLEAKKARTRLKS